jgi:hypothetical protein
MSKKIGLMVIVAMLATALFVSDSNAAPGWYTCTVEYAGPGYGGVYIQLSSASFSTRWFSVPASIQKEILAVALTAMSNGMLVLVNADLTITQPPILAFYLQ